MFDGRMKKRRSKNWQMPVIQNMTDETDFVYN